MDNIVITALPYIRIIIIMMEKIGFSVIRAALGIIYSVRRRRGIILI
jgi:hypothetical protein